MKISVLFQTESHFPVKKDFVVQVVENALEGEVNRDTEVSVTIVGDRRMKQLNRQYRNLDETTDVLSFPLSDPSQPDPEPFAPVPDKVLRLGDIVVSYPQAVIQASEQNKMVDDVIGFLIEHGLLHLLGHHHS